MKLPTIESGPGLVFALLFLAAGLPLRAQEDPGRADDAEAVRHVVEALASNVQAGDLSALDSLYAPGRGVHIIEGSGVDHGWEEYRDHHLRPELEETENLSYRYYGVEPQIRGDVAWASFRYELSADVRGEAVAVEGRGTAILERMDGRWRVVHLHTAGRRRD